MIGKFCGGLILMSLIITNALAMKESKDKHKYIGPFYLDAHDDNKENLYEKCAFGSTAVIAGYLSKDFLPIGTTGLLISALGTGLFVALQFSANTSTKKEKDAKAKPIETTWLNTGLKCIGWLASVFAINGAINCAEKVPAYVNGDSILKNIVLPLFVRRHNSY